MSVSTNNAIPFVPENTIDPAAGLNEAINTIDVLLQLAVLTVNMNTPPASPAAGDRHVVGAAPTGLWAGQGGKVARFLDGYWSFFDARFALCLADGKLYLRSASTWASAVGGGGVESVNGRTGLVILDKSDVDLDLVNNTADANKPVSTAQAAALAQKVDKAAGLQLSQESYTTIEKTKLAGLDPNHFRGMFATLAALQAAVPTANIGDYAFVDSASGADVIQYLWDNNDSKWVYNGPTAGVTAAQVKTLYESNPDTNAFTNAYKTKIDGIAAGAQVNAVTSVAGRTGAVVLAKADVSLGNVDNTADTAKPVSTAQQAALNAKANSLNPSFSGASATFATEVVRHDPASGISAGYEIGSTAGAATTPYLDFHCGAVSVDYDVRFLISGGNGSPGNGEMTIYGASIKYAADVVPAIPSTRSLGTSASRFSQVNAVNANFSGPVLVGQFTLTTLPSASAYNGYEIDVTNATGGSKRCRSNGSAWQILNTTTTVN
jgi:hypothetical protein